jgi:hypothetical protein
VAALLVTALLAGCATFKPTVRYEASYGLALERVEQPDGAREAFGVGSLQPSADSLATATEFVYDDRLFSVRLRPRSDRIELRVANKQERSLTILWDVAAFVDLDHRSLRVVPGALPPDDIGRSVPPAVVVARSWLEDSVAPANRFWYDDASEDAGWRQDPLVTPAASAWLRSDPAGREEEANFRREAEANRGRRLGLLLPVESGGATYEYTFWFHVTTASVTTDSSRATRNRAARTDSPQ